MALLPVTKGRWSSLAPLHISSSLYTAVVWLKLFSESVSQGKFGGFNSFRFIILKTIMKT